ncbi:MAG: hypothetical protein JF617_14100 [Burkholderiales bacterium]|nr:hypothetical protein [Burkholderiales bacterium]
MRFLNALASIAVLLCGAAQAAVQSTSGAQPLSAFPGYGFSYEATWDGGPVNFKLSVVSPSHGTYPSSDPYQSTYAYVDLLLDTANGWPADLTEMDLQVTWNVKFINMATGATELPSQFYGVPSAPPVYSYTSFTASEGPFVRCFRDSGTPALRISEPVCDVSTSITTLYGTNPANPSRQVGLGAASTASFHIRSGQLLYPSSDPSCPSCMTPGHDLIELPTLYLQGYATITPVDEPSEMALAVVGLALLARAARRSSHKRLRP